MSGSWEVGRALGAQPPDVLVPPSPLAALTLAEMDVRRWELKATGDRCATTLPVSRPALIGTHGPHAIWGEAGMLPRPGVRRRRVCGQARRGGFVVTVSAMDGLQASKIEGEGCVGEAVEPERRGRRAAKIIPKSEKNQPSITPGS